MSESGTEDPQRYPIGRFVLPTRPPTPQEVGRCLDRLAELPSALRQLVLGLERDQLNTSYRDGGWTIRQVVHHLADSHVHGFARTKQALTIEQPKVQAYAENAYAELVDAREGPVAFSLDLLEALHARWVWLLRRLRESDWDRTLVPPPGPAGDSKPLDLRSLVSLYAWHGEHHAAQVRELLGRRGWQ